MPQHMTQPLHFKTAGHAPCAGLRAPRFDHSAPEKQGQRSWDCRRLLGRGDNVADTVALVTALAARYATAPALLGFFLLNEPTVRRALLERTCRTPQTSGWPGAVRGQCAFNGCRCRYALPVLS